MAGWDLYDGKAQVGPLDEEHVLRMVGAGLPAETLVRRVGQSNWESLQTHAPFAMAIERRAEPTPQPAAPPRPAVVVTTPNLSKHPYVIGGTCIAALVILFAAAASSAYAPSNDAPLAPSTPTTQAQLAPQKVAAPKPVDGPVKKSNGGWVKIPRPGEDVGDTPDARITYMTNVLAAAPGEPKLDKKAAAVLLEKLRGDGEAGQPVRRSDQAFSRGFCRKPDRISRGGGGAVSTRRAMTLLGLLRGLSCDRYDRGWAQTG